MRYAVKAGASVALALCAASFAPCVLAGPAEYVLSPIVEEGEKEIDFKAGSAKMHDGTHESQYSIGLGWGATSRWFTEFYAKWHKEPGIPNSFDAFEWENRFQLTETGKYPVDVGFVVEVERPKDRSEGYEVTWGPLLQADLGAKVQANFNLLATKHVRAPVVEPAVLGYQWQLKYRAMPAFEYGLQGFGEMGEWKHWSAHDEQSHSVGPAIFGKVRAGRTAVIKYNAAVLFGMTNGAPRNTLRMQAEYEF